MKRAVSTLLALLLLSVLCVQAAGAAYSDLPAGHWAYGEMTRAGNMGFLTGYPDGTMRPDSPLSWGEYLTMLARAFFRPAYEAQPVDESAHWAVRAYAAARQVGVLEQADFLPVSPGGLDAPMARRDTAVLLDRVLRVVYHAPAAEADIALMSMAWLGTLPETYRGPVLQCYARGLIRGREDGSFGGGDTLTRGEGAALLMRTLDLAEHDSDQIVLPDEPNPPQAALPTENGSGGGGLRTLGENSDKLFRLYGTADQRRYASREEAESHMAQVTVPVWRLDQESGVKTPSTCTFSCHAAIADDMAAIFAEIFQDPEQFPIYEIGGYDWRGDTAAGEHNCGTAIDINANENYQVYADGRIGAGSCWAPGENPYSIPEDGSVVRIFRSYGYSWGGNAWPTNRDYMHFSYLGV